MSIDVKNMTLFPRQDKFYTLKLLQIAPSFKLSSLNRKSLRDLIFCENIEAF